MGVKRSPVEREPESWNEVKETAGMDTYVIIYATTQGYMCYNIPYNTWIHML